MKYTLMCIPFLPVFCKKQEASLCVEKRRHMRTQVKRHFPSVPGVNDNDGKKKRKHFWNYSV